MTEINVELFLYWLLLSMNQSCFNWYQVQYDKERGNLESWCTSDLWASVYRSPSNNVASPSIIHATMQILKPSIPLFMCFVWGNSISSHLLVTDGHYGQMDIMDRRTDGQYGQTDRWTDGQYGENVLLFRIVVLCSSARHQVYALQWIWLGELLVK